MVADALDDYWVAPSSHVGRRRGRRRCRNLPLGLALLAPGNLDVIFDGPFVSCSLFLCLSVACGSTADTGTCFRWRFESISHFFLREGGLRILRRSLPWRSCRWLQQVSSSCPSSCCAVGVSHGGVFGFLDVTAGCEQVLILAWSQQPVSIACYADQSALPLTYSYSFVPLEA